MAGPSEISPDLANDLRVVLARLPANYRQHLEMYFLKGQNIPQIAKQLGKTNEAVRLMLEAAKKKLRAELERAGYEKSLTVKHFFGWLGKSLRR